MAPFHIATLSVLMLASTSWSWRTLAPGMDLGTLRASARPAVGDSIITVLRIDPERWSLEFAGVSRTAGARTKNAREWCESEGFVAATNAGMFLADYKTHVGYMRSGGHINSASVNHYNSVAAYGPRAGSGRPIFRIFDRDAPGGDVQSLARDYALVAQNLRLIKRPGVNAWGERERRWSEAALGEDDTGRILFIFSRSGYNMRELARILLDSDLGIVAAQHLEGGPEAQLYVRVGDFELGYCGSFETDFVENDSNTMAWPVPNVLGIRARGPQD